MTKAVATLLFLMPIVPACAERPTDPVAPAVQPGIAAAAEDPCPFCDGVYLPRAGNNWHICAEIFPYADTDYDGVDQGCEAEIAHGFRPHLRFHPGEADGSRETYFAVQLGDAPRTLDVLYMLGYHWDHGDWAWNSIRYGPHPGDSEWINLVVEFDEESGRWLLVAANLSAHFGLCCWLDNTEVVPHTGLLSVNANGYDQYGLRKAPVVWVSKDKHANYKSASVCNNSEVDDCALPGVKMRVEPLYSTRNVGARNYKLKDCVQSANKTAYAGTECLWSIFTGKEKFSGWSGAQNGATHYRETLLMFGY